MPANRAPKVSDLERDVLNVIQGTRRGAWGNWGKATGQTLQRLRRRRLVKIELTDAGRAALQAQEKNDE